MNSIHLEITLPFVEERWSESAFAEIPKEGTRYSVRDKNGESKSLDVHWSGGIGTIAASPYNISEIQKGDIKDKTGNIVIAGTKNQFTLGIKFPTMTTPIIGAKVSWYEAGKYYNYDKTFGTMAHIEEEKTYRNLSIDDLFIQLSSIDKEIKILNSYILLNDVKRDLFKVISSKKLIKEAINYIASL